MTEAHPYCEDAARDEAKRIEALTAERDALAEQVKRADDLANALMAIRNRPAGLPSEIFDALAHYRALAQQEGAKG